MKQPKWPSTAEQINKIYGIPTQQNTPLQQRNEVLIHTTAWMNLKNVMLSERSGIQKSTYYIILFK